jgi:hypothetical protein
MPGPPGVGVSTLCFWLEQRPEKTLYLPWLTKFNLKLKGDASDRSAIYS